MPIFDPRLLENLARQWQGTFQSLASVEHELRQRFHDMDDAIHALALATASGEALLFVGPPGTAKSRLIRTFCEIVGIPALQGEPDERYFEYLLTPFTEPSELFGFYKISGDSLHKGVFDRDTKGMMQEATVVYLDEVFNGSSAILNSILAFLQEHRFHDRGKHYEVPWQCFFAATNQPPTNPELRAIFDRFVLRCEVGNVEPPEPKSIEALISKGWLATYGAHHLMTFPNLLKELESFREALSGLVNSGQLNPKSDDLFFGAINWLIEQARANDLSEMSNRRLVKMTYIMLINAIYRSTIHLAATPSTPINIGLSEEELKLVPKYFLDRADKQAIDRMQRQILRVPKRTP